MRRWFWARKHDAGFVLTDFPATLLQAMIFDEWLDARGESLSAVVVAAPDRSAIVDYYQMLGCEIVTAAPLSN